MLVTFVLGSVHAFSVLIVPLEQALEATRAEVSLIYSFALLALTLAVLFGYRIYALLPPWWLVFSTCLAAAAGLWLAAGAGNWWQLLAGYSLLFGFSNGIGYGYCLQLVGRALPEIRGLAMGAVTAAYAVGSIVFAKVFAWLVAAGSLAAALLALAAAIALGGLVSALLLRLARADWGGGESPPAAALRERTRVVQFWLAYMAGVFSGLMAIGHAAGIALARGADTELATLAAITIGIGSAGGGFIAGWLVDRWPISRLLVGLPLLAALALVAISLVPSAAAVVVLLSLVGFAYGAIIAVYPVAISNYFAETGPKAYGRVFTAWGFAGLVAPWSAGLIFDWRGSYDLAMLIAAGVALLSALAVVATRLGQVSERGAH